MMLIAQFSSRKMLKACYAFKKDLFFPALSASSHVIGHYEEILVSQSNVLLREDFAKAKLL
jgi:hypothetical protein